MTFFGFCFVFFLLTIIMVDAGLRDSVGKPLRKTSHGKNCPFDTPSNLVSILMCDRLLITRALSLDVREHYLAKNC